METTKIKAYVFIGFAGSGKTTALFSSLGKRIIAEKNSGKAAGEPKDLYQVVSRNTFNAGHNEIGERLCRVMTVPFVSSERDFYSLEYEKGRTYFVDTGGLELDQKAVCDLVSEEKITEVSDFLAEKGLSVVARNNSARIPNGLEEVG